MKLLASSAAVLALLALGACPQKGGPSTLGGGEAPAADAAPFAGNMADAPVHPLPSKIVHNAPCAEANYARIDAGGKAFSVTISVSSGCVMVGGLDDGGSTSADGIEVCADQPDGPHVLEMPAQPGRPMLTANERGECGGAVVTLDVAAR